MWSLRLRMNTSTQSIASTAQSQQTNDLQWKQFNVSTYHTQHSSPPPPLVLPTKNVKKAYCNSPSNNSSSSNTKKKKKKQKNCYFSTSNAYRRRTIVERISHQRCQRIRSIQLMFCQFWCSLQNPTMKWKIRTTLETTKIDVFKKNKKEVTQPGGTSLFGISVKLGFNVSTHSTMEQKRKTVWQSSNHLKVGWNITLECWLRFIVTIVVD